MEFNNREIAIIIILGISIIPFLFNAKIRKSLLKVIEVFFEGKLQIVFELSLIYIICSLIFLTIIKFWNFAFLKETLLWIIFSSFALILSVNKLSNEEKFLRKIVLANLKVVILLQYLSNLFVFSLINEIILQLVLLFIGLMSVASGMDDKLQKVHNILNILLGIFGITVFVYSLIMLINNYELIFTVGTFKELLLPIILTILYLPFIYILALYVKYEIYFVRLNHINKGNPLNGYAKFRLLLSFNFRISKFLNFSRNNPVIRYESKEEIKSILKNAV